MPYSKTELEDLKTAKQLLENVGLTAKITSLLGMPIEKSLMTLPDSWQNKIHTATKGALYKALDIAINTLDSDDVGRGSENMWHKVAVAATGGVGGAFGFTALALELPVSTTIMLRSIASIARQEGENILDPGTQLSCLEVFALGGPSKYDDSVDTGYFAVRAMLAKTMIEAAKDIASKNTSRAASSAIAKFITVISNRFGVQVSEKAAAQMIPAIGGAGGAVINTLFIDHYQNMAKGHFIIRRLEKKYGYEEIKRKYQEI
ncbi:MAG: EcsC family protein [Deltaproteobacteria bacterium]|nr:EcsC family protein [Deltaproteobacteria bacterium]